MQQRKKFGWKTVEKQSCGGGRGGQVLKFVLSPNLKRPRNKTWKRTYFNLIAEALPTPRLHEIDL